MNGFILIFASISIFLWISTSCQGQLDPCQLGNYKYLHRPGQRGTLCPSNLHCDRFIDEDWYIVQHEDDVRPRILVDSPPENFMCGGDFPLWLNGTHPSITDGIVDRNVCMKVYSDDCKRSQRIKIKNCTTFYVYRLLPTTTCPAMYCFGYQKPCAKLNPCYSENYELVPDINTRRSTCKISEHRGCDDSLTSGWYRAVSNKYDVKMPKSCVENFRCGTTFPIWLNDSEPKIEELTVVKTACVSGPTLCCEKEYHIEIRNCTNFLVYNLSATQQSRCPERYCFGGQIGQCETVTQSVNPKRETSKCESTCQNIIIVVAVIVCLFVLTSLAIYKYSSSKKRRVNDGEKCTTTAKNEKHCPDPETLGRLSMCSKAKQSL